MDDAAGRRRPAFHEYCPRQFTRHTNHILAAAAWPSAYDLLRFATGRQNKTAPPLSHNRLPGISGHESVAQPISRGAQSGPTVTATAVHPIRDKVPLYLVKPPASHRRGWIDPSLLHPLDPHTNTNGKYPPKKQITIQTLVHSRGVYQTHRITTKTAHIHINNTHADILCSHTNSDSLLLCRHY